jgi:hypothetical protein
MSRLFRLIATLFCLMVLNGCSAYVGDFAYVPHPALAEIPPAPPDKSPPVSAFATVIGIHRADRDLDIPLSVEVRFRLENNGTHTIVFDPQSLQLSTGDLVGFDPPIVTPAHMITLAPSDTAVFDAFFPFPPHRSYDNTDLRSLELRWREQIDGSPVSQSIAFRRTYPYHYFYSDPYWGDPWFGGGVVIIGGHRHWR